MNARAVRRRDLRLVPVVIMAWSSALAASFLPEAAPALAAALWGTAGLATALAALTARAMRAARTAVLALAAVALAAGAAVATHVAVAQPDRAAALSLPFSGGRALDVEATVTGKIERTPTGWRFDAATRHIAVGAEGRSLGVPIVVRSSDRPFGLELGARIELTGTAFASDAGERAVLVVDASDVDVRAPAAGVLGATALLRQQLLDQAVSLPQPGSGLIAGLAVGDTGALSEELDADMKTASLSHLTAVSGANCALVVGIAYGIAGAAGLRRGMRVASGLVALGAFVVLVSPEPSVVRAAAMAAIAMVAVLLGRAGAGVPVLCLAVTTCLVVDPWLGGALGFALSAGATAALLLAAAPIAETFGRFMPRPIALSLAVPLAAQLACTPLLVAIDPRIPVYAIVANVLAAPAAPAATVLGLAACLAAPVPVLAAGLAALAWLPCAFIAGTAVTLARLPASSLPWWSGWEGAVAASVCCAAVLVALLPRAHPLVRRIAAGITAVVAGAGLGAVLLDGPVGRASVPQDWAIAVCDVGQGDAVLLRSADQVALIDTGPEPEPLRRCLDRFGIDDVDLLVLTHFDLDHRGGVDAVLGRTGLLLHGPPEPDDRATIRAFTAGGARVQQASAGMTGMLGEAHWRVLWPRAGGVGYPPGNDASVVLEVRGGGVPSILLLGDLSTSPQRAMAAAVNGPYDVVKVAHHGSADQFDGLYRRVAATVALVTVGENGYGHPRDEILDLVVSLGATIVRTDQTGAGAVVVDGSGLRLWRERPPSDVEGHR